MALKKLTTPGVNPGGVDELYGEDWNRLIDALTGGVAETLHFISASGNDLFMQDAGGNITINPAATKVLTIGNLSGANIDQYIPLIMKQASAYISLFPTGKLFLDGGGDTYLQESSSNVVDIVCGGSVRARLNTLEAALRIFPVGANTLQAGSTAPVFLIQNYPAVVYNAYYDSVYKVWTGGKYTGALEYNTDSGYFRFLVGDNPATLGDAATLLEALRITNNRDVALQAAKKLFLDGAGDTYIHESSANVISFVAGATEALTVQINQVKFIWTVLAADPTTGNLPAGYIAAFKNSTSGDLKLWANDGGVMKSAAFA